MRSSGIRRLGMSAAIVIGALFVVALMSRPSDSAGPCTVTHRGVLPDVPEASGLAVSRRFGLLWTHNDSGNDAVLFALDESGAVHGRVRVPAHMRDWEDVSASSCPVASRFPPSQGCLYLGDIGDNSLDRRRIQVLVVREPDPSDTETVRPDTYSVAYADRAHNAEAMFITGGRLYIVTRDRIGALYGTAAPLADAHEVTLQRISELGLVGVTDAETSPDAASVVVRTSHEVVLYRTADLIRGAVNPRMRIRIDGLREPQGEAVAVGESGMLYLASEGGWTSRAGRLTTLRCSVAL